MGLVSLLLILKVFSKIFNEFIHDWKLAYEDVEWRHFDVQAGSYLFKVKNGNTRASCEICLKLTVKIPKRCQNDASGVYFTPCSSVSIVNFEQLNAGWDLVSL